MAKVTPKYQVTIPKKIAEQVAICPGDSIDWVVAGEVIRVIPAARPANGDVRKSRLRLFDQATERCRKRFSNSGGEISKDRGWTREDLYQRGSSSGH